MHTFQPHLLPIHSVMCCTLQCVGHKGMSLASVPPFVFVGQSIAHNDVSSAYAVKKAIRIEL